MSKKLFSVGIIMTIAWVLGLTVFKANAIIHVLPAIVIFGSLAGLYRDRSLMK